MHPLLLSTLLLLSGTGPGLAAAPPTTTCLTQPMPPLPWQRRAVSCAAGIRFYVTTPGGCTADAPCGLIFDVHGKNMSAADQEKHTGLAARGPGAEQRWIVVQPEAANGVWTDRNNPEASMDKFDVVAGFMDELRRSPHLAIDPSRIWITGFSQGGVMAWYFFCRYPRLISGAAPLAYAAAYGFCTAADMDNGLPVLYSHGKCDRAALDGSRQETVGMLEQGRDYRPIDLSNGDECDKSYRLHRRHRPGEGPFIMLDHQFTGGTWFTPGHCYPGRSSAIHSCDKDLTIDGEKVDWGRLLLRFFADPSGLIPAATESH